FAGPIPAPAGLRPDRPCTRNLCPDGNSCAGWYVERVTGHHPPPLVQGRFLGVVGDAAGYAHIFCLGRPGTGAALRSCPGDRRRRRLERRHCCSHRHPSGAEDSMARKTASGATLDWSEFGRLLIDLERGLSQLSAFMAGRVREAGNAVPDRLAETVADISDRVRTTLRHN